MKLSDYVVNWLYEKGIKDFYGYQGTMIAHFINSIGEHPYVQNHSCYNEQAAAFAACGHAIASDSCAVAYATSGPGAINLVSGIANAYYDSTPVIFFTGQINTYEYRRDLPKLRQNAFQETKIVEMVSGITKYATQVLEPEMIRYELEKAYFLANDGRKGPVLLDVPMNIQRAEINPEKLIGFTPEFLQTFNLEKAWLELESAVNKSKRPVLLLGNGITRKDYPVFIELSKQLNIPIVTSLLARGNVPFDYDLNFGYLGGAYGHRYANLITALKSDQLIAVGISLCTRQTGVNVSAFASNANVLRFDIDEEELNRKINNEEVSVLIDTAVLAEMLRNKMDKWTKWKRCDEEWISYCTEYRGVCREYDYSLDVRYPNRVIEEFSKYIKKEDVVTCDVGQHMMWVGQSLLNKGSQPVIFSGGHGAMGFALPAALGAYNAFTKSKIFCFCGDGAFQMNIQELQWVAREQSNIVIIVLNNNSLGLITQQQDAYFEKKHYGADAPEFTSPSFTNVAKAYGIESVCIRSIGEIDEVMNNCPVNAPYIIEYMFDEQTQALPKTVLGQPIFDQEPRLPKNVFDRFINNKYWD